MERGGIGREGDGEGKRERGRINRRLPPPQKKIGSYGTPTSFCWGDLFCFETPDMET